MVGVKGGANPARTWNRWENGEREPPMAVVAEIERVSAGAVTAGSWAAVRAQFLAAAPVTSEAAA